MGGGFYIEKMAIFIGIRILACNSFITDPVEDSLHAVTVAYPLLARSSNLLFQCVIWLT
jgi:hypothetical protein